MLSRNGRKRHVSNGKCTPKDCGVPQDSERGTLLDILRTMYQRLLPIKRGVQRRLSVGNLRETNSFGEILKQGSEYIPTRGHSANHKYMWWRWSCLNFKRNTLPTRRRGKATKWRRLKEDGDSLHNKSRFATRSINEENESACKENLYQKANTLESAGDYKGSRMNRPKRRQQ